MGLVYTSRFGAAHKADWIQSMIANNLQALLQAVRTFITRMCSRQSVTCCEGEAGPAVTRHASDRPELHMQNSRYND
jgi:NADP-dependent 3-hydroxy acid dehydrogenase YdfG